MHTRSSPAPAPGPVADADVRAERLTIQGTAGSFFTSLRTLVAEFMHLVLLEAKQAGISIALMLGFGFAAGILIITGWLAVVGAIVAALAHFEIIGWTWGLLIAALLSFAGSAALGFLIYQHAGNLLFPATRRQLAGRNEDEPR